MKIRVVDMKKLLIGIVCVILMMKRRITIVFETVGSLQQCYMRCGGGGTTPMREEDWEWWFYGYLER